MLATPRRCIGRVPSERDRGSRTTPGNRRTRVNRSPVRFSLADCRIRTEAFVDELRGGRGRPPGQGSHGMTQYLISFDFHAMDHIPDEDMPAVGKAAHAVV